jgi:ArsR family transcriptional regulator, arsenate/arsenite/antimonite-responsive transcriptional repressor
MTDTADQATPALADPIRRTCELFRLLAGHEVLGLAPSEIANGLRVPPSWVSQNLPALAGIGFVEQVAHTKRWRLGVQFVRIAVTVGCNLHAAKRQLEDLSQRCAVPVGDAVGIDLRYRQPISAEELAQHFGL